MSSPGIKYVRVGPGDGRPSLEVELEDGTLQIVALDPAHARAIGARLLECVDGTILTRAPSRRMLEIECVKVSA